MIYIFKIFEVNSGQELLLFPQKFAHLQILRIYLGKMYGVKIRTTSAFYSYVQIIGKQSKQNLNFVSIFDIG